MPHRSQTIPVEYHVLLSATYRVPVLYFQVLRSPEQSGADGVDQILEHIVPMQYRQQVGSVGVLGAISMTVRVYAGEYTYSGS